MRKIDRVKVYFQRVHMYTGVDIGKPWISVRTIYHRNGLVMVRHTGQLHEAWHCPTDKVWKCHIPVGHIQPVMHMPTTWHSQPQNQMEV